jgi:hypothetical protein
MQRFTNRRVSKDRGLRITYRFDTGLTEDEGHRVLQKVVDVEVAYTLGGWNNWYGRNDPRGVQILVTPKGVRDGMESMTLMAEPPEGGLRAMLLQQERRSDKSTERVAALLDKDERVVRLCELWYPDNAAAQKLLAEVIADTRAILTGNLTPAGAAP